MEPEAMNIVLRWSIYQGVIICWSSLLILVDCGDIFDQ